MIGKINSLSRPPLSDALFGNGSDGALTIAKNQTVALDVEEDSGQIIKQYSSLTIEEGATLKPAHRCNGTIILVNGDCTINGTLSVDKCSPLENDAESDCYNNANIAVCGFLEGGAGGTGGDGYQSPPHKKYNAEIQDYDEVLDGELCGVGGTGTEGHVFGGGYGGGGAGSRGDTVKYSYNSSTNSFDTLPVDNIFNCNGGSYETRPVKGMVWPCTTSSTYGAGGQASTSEYTYYYHTYPNPDGNGNITETYPMDDHKISDGGAAPGGSGGSAYKMDTESPSGTLEKLSGTAGDAYGGGALWLYVKGTLTIGTKGKITANGGKGVSIAPIDAQYHTTMQGYPGSGGSGGGGIVAIVYGAGYTNEGTVEARGGESSFFDGSKYQYRYNNAYTKYYKDSSGKIQSIKCQFIEAVPRTAGSAGSIGSVFVKNFADL